MTLLDNLLEDLSDEEQVKNDGLLNQKLRTVHSKKVKDLMEALEGGKGDDSFELVMEANKCMVGLENDIETIFSELKILYGKKMPELSSLVVNAYDYIQTVYILKDVKNNTNVSEIVEKLNFLPPATKMVVSISLHNLDPSKMTLLKTNELEQIDKMCELAGECSKIRLNLFNFIESRMAFIAPNLSYLTGVSIAAQLINSVGGLDKLAKLPSCNLEDLGAEKSFNSAGRKKNPHSGFLFNSEFVTKWPISLRKKACRLLSSKCTLAVRMDLYKANLNNHYGAQLYEKIDAQMNELLKPAPVKIVKALPRPDENQNKKKRGGKRQRRAKEQVALTELRKQANTIKFGEIQDDLYQTAIGFTQGAITSNRVNVVDNKKAKTLANKRLQKNLTNFKNTSGIVTGWRTSLEKFETTNTNNGAVSTVLATNRKKNSTGLESSVVYTQGVGLEIKNEEAIKSDSKKLADGFKTPYSYFK